MTLQQPWSGEALAAVAALAALAVRAHVHAVGRHAHVHLVAVRTASRLLVGEGAVSLPVSRQVAGGAVRLAAVHATVLLYLPLLLLLDKARYCDKYSSSETSPIYWS